MKRRLVIISLAAFAIACSSVVADAPSVTTVILVRHAEKVDTSSNPDLSPEGYARATRLAALLRDVPITAIYTTPYTRTRKTAEPIATASKLTPTEIAAGKDLAATTASRIREHAGKTVLVVGHSNTIPDTLRALGVADVPAIDDSEFDRLFICTLVDGKPVATIALRY